MSKLEFNQLSQKIRFKKRPFNFTENQVNFLKTSLNKESKLMFLAGPAGTAKTYMAVYSALQIMIDSGLEKDILYIRSIAESADRNMGSLPGSIEEKFGVFASPFYDKLDELLNVSDIKLLKDKKQFECIPVNFVRGANWNDTVVIIDEAQNFTFNELITVLTRIGENSKIIICGDMMQSDIRHSGFSKIFKTFDDDESKENGIFCTSFSVEDIKRSQILKFIVSKLDKEI